MKNTVSRPPDVIDEEWLAAICDHCLLTALCADYPDCCPVQRIRRLLHRAQVPDSALIAALAQARQFLKEDK